MFFKIQFLQRVGKEIMRKVKIKVNNEEKVIGTIDTKDKVFYKNVDIDIHLFKKLDSWGINERFFEKKLLPENYKIVIRERKEKMLYKAMAKDIDKKGFRVHFKKKIDNGLQIFYPRKLWKKESENKKYNIEELAKSGVFG
jgi:hypothetical protein